MSESIPFDERTVIALGGNALEGVDSDGNQDVFCVENISTSMIAVADICPGELIVTHGSGPQWGQLWNENIRENKGFYPDHIARMVQFRVGNIMKQIIEADNTYWRDVFVHLTEVEVDPEHQSFNEPVKGVGNWNTRASHIREGIDFRNLRKSPEDNGLWREMVPSPLPQAIVDIETIIKGVEARFDGSDDPRHIVVCGGGGGVPVVKKNGVYVPVKKKVVIDKDLSSAIIADSADAKVFVIATKPDGFYENYGTDRARLIPQMSVAEAAQRVEENKNGEGSMNPKIAAAAAFVRAGIGRVGLITSLDNLKEYAEVRREGFLKYDFTRRATLITS